MVGLAEVLSSCKYQPLALMVCRASCTLQSHTSFTLSTTAILHCSVIHTIQLQISAVHFCSVVLYIGCRRVRPSLQDHRLVSAVQFLAVTNDVIQFLTIINDVIKLLASISAVIPKSGRGAFVGRAEIYSAFRQHIFTGPCVMRDLLGCRHGRHAVAHRLWTLRYFSGHFLKARLESDGQQTQAKF